MTMDIADVQNMADDLASMVWEYHVSLLERGFSDGQAFQLTALFQNSILMMVSHNQSGSEKR